MKGEIIELDVEDSLMIEGLSVKIEEKTGIAVAQQKLIHKGKQLSESKKTIKDYEIQENDFIILLTMKVSLKESYH